jgi:hypothetical protein
VVAVRGKDGVRPLQQAVHAEPNRLNPREVRLDRVAGRGGAVATAATGERDQRGREGQRDARGSDQYPYPPPPPVPPLVAGLVVVVGPVDVVVVPPPEADVGVLGAGLEAVEPLSLELPPQPATAAASAIAPATAQALIVRSIISSLWFA